MEAVVGLSSRERYINWHRSLNEPATQRESQEWERIFTVLREKEIEAQEREKKRKE